MGVAPLVRPLPGRERLAASGRARARVAPTPRRIARRRFMVTVTKWLLPVLAAMLLGSIAVWPEFVRLSDQGRVSFRRAFSTDAGEARLTDPRYRGADERGRPYTVSADTAVQAAPGRVNLESPIADAVLEDGRWMMLRSKAGVYVQSADQLDLSGDVTLYRDDGTTLTTSSVTADLKQGAATSDAPTHAEGPFGVLDSQGFTLVDKGAVVQFQGPSRLVLNEAAR